MADPPKYEFAKLELKAGDILVLKINAPRIDVTHERIKALRKAAEAQLPEGVFCFILGPEVDVSTITREQAGPLIEGTTSKPSKAKK